MIVAPWGYIKLKAVAYAVVPNGIFLYYNNIYVIMIISLCFLCIIIIITFNINVL